MNHQAFNETMLLLRRIEYLVNKKESNPPLYLRQIIRNPVFNEDHFEDVATIKKFIINYQKIQQEEK